MATEVGSGVKALDIRDVELLLSIEAFGNLPASLLLTGFIKRF